GRDRTGRRPCDQADPGAADRRVVVRRGPQAPTPRAARARSARPGPGARQRLSIDSIPAKTAGLHGPCRGSVKDPLSISIGGETGGKTRGTPMTKPLGSLLALMVVCVAPALAANPVRISQIYGGGGNTTGTPSYKYDYIEVYNSGDVAVDIGGWWLQYGT